MMALEDDKSEPLLGVSTMTDKKNEALISERGGTETLSVKLREE